jgi:hypothetical protein
MTKLRFAIVALLPSSPLSAGAGDADLGPDQGFTKPEHDNRAD